MGCFSRLSVSETDVHSGAQSIYNAHRQLYGVRLRMPSGVYHETLSLNNMTRVYITSEHTSSLYIVIWRLIQFCGRRLEAPPFRFTTFPVNITSAGRLRSLKCSRDMAHIFSQFCYKLSVANPKVADKVGS